MSCGIMTYKIDNAIVKKDVTGKLTLIDCLREEYRKRYCQK